MGEEVERWEAGELKCYLTVTEVTDTTATVTAESGYTAVLYREHTGGVVRNTYAMGFASYHIKGSVHFPGSAAKWV